MHSIIIRLMKYFIHQFKKNICKLYIISLVILYFPAAQHVSAFTIKDKGYSFVSNYLKEDYKAATQNWDIVQDNKGLLYFANSGGLLQFDGSFWRLYPLPNNSIVRAVCIDKENRIWVGGFNQIGYFKTNEKGELAYHSAVNLLEPQYRDFGDIWEIYPDNNRLIIQTFTAILEFKGGILRPLIWDSDIHYSFFYKGNLYVKVNNVGLNILKENQLELIPDGKIFSDYTVTAILPGNNNKTFIVTANNGVFQMKDSKISPFNTPVNDFLKKYQVFDAIYYKEYYFLGTVQNGLLILDKDFNPIQHINQERGLQNNTVLALMIDKAENLWLGLDNGIDYVKISSPLSYIVNKNEVGAGYQTVRYRNNLYFGTNQGLYYMPWNNSDVLKTTSQLKPVEGMQGQVWMLQVYDNILFCGHDKGTFIIDQNNKSRQISDVAGAYNLFPIPNTNFFVQGTYSGLVILERKQTPSGVKFEFRNKIENFNNSGKNLIIDKSNNIWVGHGYKGIYRLTISPDFRSVYKQKHYGKDQGLPETFGLSLLPFDDQMIISSEKGYYYYNKEKDFFFPHEILNSTFSHETVHQLIPDPNNKNTWFFTDKRMGVLKPNFDGTYNIEYIPFVELSGKFLAGYESVNFLSNASIIVASEDGFVHFDPTYKKNYNSAFTAMIRQVYTAGDSMLFGGNSFMDKNYSKNLTLEYNSNSVLLKFSTPQFETPENLFFSYILMGFDKSWSDWSTNTEKEYTNLPAGDYVFKVKAKNIYGFESSEDKLILTVLPPWYQSTGAYIIYIILGILIITAIVLYVIKRFEKERTTLEEKQKNELSIREQEYERESLKAEQEIIKLRNEKLTIENQKKQSEIENKTKELASIAMQITYKNEMLTKVRQKLAKVSQKMIHRESKQQVEGLIKTLEKDMVRDDEWEKFEISFDQVHEDFLKKLRTSYSQLSPKDLRLCAYLRMNLSSKEIAPLLNISIRGVEISRYRLRRKLNIDRETNLTEFMMNL